MSNTRLDPRVNAYRSDLADAALQGKLEAERFITPLPAVVIDEAAPVHASPRFDSSYETQALFGEQVNIFDDQEGWSWVQLLNDGYVGYMPSGCLSQTVLPASHKVITLRTFIYPGPSIKAPPTGALSLNSSVSVVREAEQFVELAGGGYVYSRHVAPAGENADDFVAVAEKFVNIPYLWGGKSSLGLDCSALIQTALHATGSQAPRDSDMQEQQLGQPVSVSEPFDNLQRGDLVFWKGHVGVMVDSRNLLHANGYHMKTVVEPLNEAVKRIAEMYGALTSVRRL